jgi:hypothetical protein
VEPPAPITLTAENWLAPVNTSKEIAHACNTEAPALTAPTPNEKPKTPTARAMVTLAEMTERMRGSRSASVNWIRSRAYRAQQHNAERWQVELHRCRLTLPCVFGGR